AGESHARFGGRGGLAFPTPISSRKSHQLHLWEVQFTGRMEAAGFPGVGKMLNHRAHEHSPSKLSFAQRQGNLRSVVVSCNASIAAQSCASNKRIVDLEMRILG